MTNSIIEKLTAYISTIALGKKHVSIEANTPLISSGIIDSFELIDLSLFVEDEFNVEIKDTELSASVFDNVNQLADLIRKRQENTLNKADHHA